MHAARTAPVQGSLLAHKHCYGAWSRAFQLAPRNWPFWPTASPNPQAPVPSYPDGRSTTTNPQSGVHGIRVVPGPAEWRLITCPSVIRSLGCSPPKGLFPPLSSQMSTRQYLRYEGSRRSRLPEVARRFKSMKQQNAHMGDRMTRRPGSGTRRGQGDRFAMRAPPTGLAARRRNDLEAGCPQPGGCR